MNVFTQEKTRENLLLDKRNVSTKIKLNTFSHFAKLKKKKLAQWLEMRQVLNRLISLSVMNETVKLPLWAMFDLWLIPTTPIGKLPETLCLMCIFFFLFIML